MELLDLKSVNRTLAKKLLIDSWTVERLATTTAPILAKVRGISLKGASQIIVEAQELVNNTKLTEFILEPIFEEIASSGMSPRVRRAKASKNK